MNEHITDLLSAYLDGELRGLRLRQVEDHLTICAACRQELDELRSLSGLLHETLPAKAFTPTERFAVNLALWLPRRPERAPARKVSESAWWLVPAGAVSVWIFLQTATIVSTLVTTAGAAGLLGNAASWLQSGPQQSVWFSASMNLFGSDLSGSSRTLLTILNSISVFETGFWAQLVWQAGIGLVILVWLAAWLTHVRTGGQSRFPQTGSHS